MEFKFAEYIWNQIVVRSYIDHNKKNKLMQRDEYVLSQ